MSAAPRLVSAILGPYRSPTPELNSSNSANSKISRLSRPHDPSNSLPHLLHISPCRLVLSWRSPYHPASHCRTTRLTDRDARQILSTIPQALTTKRLGGRLSFVEWRPQRGYRTDLFFLFQLLTTATSITALNNGLIGYFGVNKITGEVVELSSAEPNVRGQKLRRTQAEVRARHCIPEKLVRRNSAIPLEKD